MTIKEIVLLWHETQIGNMYKCKEKQAEFSEIMWGLYEKINTEECEQQCTGDEVI